MSPLCFPTIPSMPRALVLWAGLSLSWLPLPGQDGETKPFLELLSLWNDSVDGRLSLSTAMKQTQWYSIHAGETAVHPFAAYEGRNFANLEPIWTHALSYQMNPNSMVNLSFSLEYLAPTSGMTAYWPSFPGGSDIGNDAVNYRIGHVTASLGLSVTAGSLKYAFSVSHTTENVDRIGTVNPYQSFTVGQTPYKQGGILLDPASLRDWITMASTQYEFRANRMSLRISPSDGKTTTDLLQPTFGVTFQTLQILYTNQQSLNQDNGAKTLMQMPYRDTLSMDANLKIFPTKPLNFSVGGALAALMVGNDDEKPGIGTTPQGTIALDPGLAQVFYATAKWTTDGVSVGASLTMTNTPYRIQTGLSSPKWSARDQFSAVVGALRAYEKDIYFRHVNLRCEFW